MVLNPYDTTLFNGDEQATFDAVQASLDDALRRSWRHREKHATLTLPVPNRILRDEVISAYTAAGWTVAYEHGTWHLTPDNSWTDDRDMRHPAEPYRRL
jgi:hypothetical protein